MWCTGLRSPVPGPLYAFASRHASQSVKPLPLYVLVTLENLKKKMFQTRHCPCGLQRRSWKEAWRVDAHADENGVGVGGRKPTRREWSTRGTHPGLRSKSHLKTHRGLSQEKGEPTE